MSRANAETVRLVVEAVNRGELEAVEALVSEDLEFRSTFAASEGRVFRGHEGVREYFATIEESFDDVHLDVEDVIEAGSDRAVLLLRVSGRGKGSSVPVEHRYGQVWTMSEGTVRQVHSYLNPSEALKAAGVRA